MKKLLVANRGEIAVRIIRAAREVGIRTVAIYSDVDSAALHTRLADERVALGGVRAADTYLNAEKILNAARISGADAIHPGYGFFSENPKFASAVCEAGFTFVGPGPDIIALMADKDAARKKAIEVGVPVVPGTTVEDSSKGLFDFAEKAGYPVIFKAVAGGSGRGMRVVRSKDELEAKRKEAESEALAAFSDKRVFLEKFLERPRHIEIQLFGDNAGNVLHFGERECSVQRRHQKIIEEAPAANLHPKVRERMITEAVRLAKAVKYVNSGTVEFLVEDGTTADSKFYFVEMNTRIQVEHPVTECVCGVDLVKLQLHVAMGKELPWKQEEITFTGSSFEFRVYAESPAKQFSPTGGEIVYLSRPGGYGVREESWVEAGTTVSPYYDSLLSKIIVSGNTRDEALQRAKARLHEYALEGVETTLGFHRWMLEQPDMTSGRVDVYWIQRNYKGATVAPRSVTGPLMLAAVTSREGHGT